MRKTASIVHLVILLAISFNLSASEALFNCKLDSKSSVFESFNQDTTYISLDQLNETLISYVDSGSYTNVEYLLSLGADPNYYNEFGVTPLMYASDNGYFKIAKLLIEKGAKVNFKPSGGNTALFAAVRNNNDSIAELLLQNKANVNETNSLGLIPLHYAVSYGYPYLASLLIDYDSELDVQDLDGNTPLMSAVYAGAIEATGILISAGANVNLPDKYGNTPLMVAAQFNDTTLIKILYNAGADLNKVNNQNNSALAFALKNNSVDAFKLLLSLETKLNPVQDFRSYYQRAYELKSYAIAAFLKEKGINTKLRPKIFNIGLYSGFSVGKNDFMADFGLGIFESVSSMIINIGYKYRPYSNRVLVYQNSSYYQYWERRYSVYLSLQHLYSLKQDFLGGNFGFTSGLNNELSWKYYRGYSAGSGLKWIPVPSLGLFYQSDFFTMLCKWEYAKYYSNISSNNRFDLQLYINIPTTKRISKKRIEWLD